MSKQLNYLRHTMLEQFSQGASFDQFYTCKFGHRQQVPSRLASSLRDAGLGGIPEAAALSVLWQHTTGTVSF